MGNEQTKDRDLNMNGKVLVNGVSANITQNGMKIDANGKTIVQQNGGPMSFDLSTESTDYVVVESDSPYADAPVISETLETITQTEQVNESKGEKVNGSGKTFENDVKIVQGKETSNEEQTSVSPPATDPQLELDSCGHDAAAVIITNLGEDEKSETSTQIDRRADTNISTHTGDEGQTPQVEGPMEEVATEEATEEDTLVESAAVIAEEVVEATADVEPSDSQTAGIIIEEVVIINDDVYENIELRVEEAEVTNSFEINPHKNCDPEKEATNETKAEIAEESETNPNKFSVGGETVDEDHILDKAFPSEISSSFPKEVADCTEAVLSPAPESSYITALNKMEPSVHEVITEDNDKGASELSADAVLIELALSESSAVTPEVMESNGFPSFEEEPVHTIMETNSEVVCEEPKQTPANQVVPKEEPSIPLQVEHANEEATADEAVAVEDVPVISEELISEEASSNELMTTEGLLKDTSSFPEDESKSESILEIIASEENAEVSGDVMADVTAQEEEPGPVIVKDDTEVTLEAAIDVLSQDFELSPITSEVAAVENGIPLIEELITATTFVPLSRGQEASLPVPETVAEEMTRDSTEALSNEFDVVPYNVEEDTIVQEPPSEEVIRKESEKSVVEASEDVLAQAETPEQIPVLSEKSTEENPSTCEEAATTEVLMEELLADTISERPEVIAIKVEEPAAEQADVPEKEATAEYESCISVQEFVEENAAPTEPQEISPIISEEPANVVLVGLLETTDDKNKYKTTQGTDNSCEVFAAVDENSEDSQNPTFDEPVAEAVEDPLATAGEDIITEDALAVCDILTMEQMAPATILGEETTEVTMDKLQVTENITVELADEHYDVPQSMTTAESGPCVVFQEEPVEENVTLSISAEEETMDSSPANSGKPVEENAILLEPQEDLVVILKTTEGEVTDKTTHESDTSDDVSASVDRSSEISHISTSNEPVTECVEDVACSTLAVDIITEDNTAKFNLLTTGNTAPETIHKGEIEERAEGESNVNSKASLQSAILIEDTPVTSRDMGVLPDRLESACATTDEAILERLEVTENIFEEPAEEQANGPQIEAPGESVPNISVQEELVKENSDSSVVAVEEPTDSSPDFSEEPVEGNVNHLEAQVLVENLKTTEDEATGVSAQKTDTSGNDVAAVDKNPMDSQMSTSDEPVAECVEAVLDTIVDDIATEDVRAVCNLMSSAEVVLESIPEGENGEKAESPSNVKSIASLHGTDDLEDSSVTATDTEAFPDTKNIIEEPADEQTQDVAQSVTTAGSVPSVSVQEELVENSIDKSAVAVEELRDSSSVISEEGNVSLLKAQVLFENLKTTEDKVTEVSEHQTETFQNVSPAVDRSSEDYHTSTSDEPVAEYVEAVVDTVAEDVNTEDVMAECNLVNSEKTAPEIVHKEETEERAESESNVNSTASLHNAEMTEDTPATSTDMEILPVGLQSACIISAEDISEKLEDTEKILEEPAEKHTDATLMEVTGESVPCISVQEELVEENVAKSVVALAETTDSIPVNSEEPVEEKISPLEPQEDLLIILKTTEGEVTVKSTHESDTSDDVSASVDRSSEDYHTSTSDEPEAECVEAAAHSTLEADIITEDDTAEFNLLTTGNTAQEIFIEGETEERAEGESNVNPAASMQSAISIEDTPVTSSDIEVLPVGLESACVTTDEAMLERLEVTENIFEEPAEEQANGPQIEAPGESVPNISVQEELIEENLDKSVVAVAEPADTSPDFSEEPVEGNVSPLEAQVLVENHKTTEDEATGVSAQKTDTSGNDVVAVDKNPMNSQMSTSDEPVAECVEAGLDTIVDDIATEDVRAVCNLMSSAEVVPETIHEGENGEKAESESNVNSIASLHSADNLEDTPVMSTDMEILPVGLHSAFTSVTEVTMDKLLVTINMIEEPADEQADVSQSMTTTKSAPSVSVQEELVEENVAKSFATDSSPVNSEEPVGENLSPIEPQEEVLILRTTEDEVTDKTTHESDTSDDVPASVDRSSEDSQISTSDEPEAECVEAILDTIVDDIRTENVTAACNLVSSEEVAPEIIHDGGNGEKAECESTVNPTASMHSVEMTEDTPVMSTDLEALPLRLHSALTSVTKATSDELEDTEIIIEELADEQADVPQIEDMRLLVQCFSVQEELVENDDKSIVAVEEPTDSSHANSEEPLKENFSPVKPQEDLVVILKTTEDEVTVKSTHESDTSDDLPASVDRSSEDNHTSTSDEPEAKCVEAVVDSTVAEDITTEDAIAECNLMTLEKVTLKIISEEETEERAEGESTVTSTASTQSAKLIEDTPVATTDMEVLTVRLESVCATALEAIPEKLEVTEMLVKESTDEQADVLQMEVIEEFVPSVLVQEDLVEDNVDKSVVLEPKDSSPVNFEEPVKENVSPNESQELVIILKTTEDEVTDKSTHESDTSDYVLAAVDKNSENSKMSTFSEPVAECVEAVVNSTVADDILTEDVKAECYIVTLEKTASEIIPEEKTNVISEASTQSAEMIEDTPFTSTDMEVLPVSLESVCMTTATEMIPDGLAVTENIFEETAEVQEDAPAMEVPGESVPCISVQEELVEENVAKSVVALEETTGSSPVYFEEPGEENVSPLNPQDELQIIKTTEDEVADKSSHESDTSDDVSVSFDKNFEDSHISTLDEPVAECVEAGLDTTVANDIITEDIMVECYVVTSEKRAPEIIPEEKTNSNPAALIQSAEMTEDTPITSTDMEVLPVSLKSACTTTALEVIPDGLAVTENISEETAEEKEDAPLVQVTGESMPCVSVQEELAEENVAISVVALEETTDSSPVSFEELVERSESSLEPQEDLLILKTTQDKFTEKSTHETDKSEKNSEDSHISTSDEPVTECVEAVLDTISEDITTEDITAECNMTLVKVVPEIITAGDTAEMTESESHATAVMQTAEMIGNTSITSTDMEALLETANLKQERESLTEPESVTVDAGPEEERAPDTDSGNSQSVENQEDSDGKDIPIMNFFKTLVSSTKTKKETATPDATKDKSQKESQPAAATTVAQVSEPPAAPKAMSVPPPPPPEPPKMEIKGEPAAKPVKPSPKEEPKAAAKEPESSKGISARDSLGRFFRKKVLLSVKASKGKGASASGADAPAKTAPGKMEETPKPAVEVEVQQEVEVQDSPLEVQQPVADVQRENNAEPLETAVEVTQVVVEEQTVEEVAQPDVEAEKVDPSKAGTLEASPKPEPPPPVQEEKKTASKSSFLSLFKPKAADPKKATPAPAAAAEAAQTAKAKEEPKAAAKSSEAAVENKPASAASKAGDDAAEGPKKQEKRNSITLLFKILGQKRNSTDAGVQTEPVAVAPAAEKAK